MKKRSFWIWLILAAFPVSLYSQTTSWLDVDELNLEALLNTEVITASRKAQKSAEAPASVYAISAEIIRQRGYRNLLDLLEDIPEVEVQHKSQPEMWDPITIRGIAGNEKFIILLDGVRISSATGDWHAVDSNYPLVNVERVEVILGPASALYGADAFSGIVHIITNADTTGLQMTGSYGRFGTTDNSFSLRRKVGDFSVQATGHFYHSDEPFMPEFYPKEFAGYERYRQEGKMPLGPWAPDVLVDVPIKPYETPTNSHFLDIRARLGESLIGYTRSYQSHNTSLSYDPSYAMHIKDAQWNFAIETLFGIHNYATADNKLNLRSGVSRQMYQLDPETHFRNLYTGGYAAGYKYSLNTTIKFEEQLSITLSERMTFVGGSSFETVSCLPKTGDMPRPFDPDLAGPNQNMYYAGTNITDADGDTLIVYQDFYYLNFRNYGLYGQLQTRLTPKIELTLGSRWDHNTRYGSTFNPRLGLTAGLTDQIKAKLLYGRAYLSPSPYKSYQHFGSFYPTTNDAGEIIGLASAFWHLPNADLKPEILQSVEGSVSAYITPSIAFSVNAYHVDIQDLIVNTIVFDSAFKGIPVAVVETPRNKGKSESYGGTVGLNILAKTGNLKATTRLYYSFVDGEIDNKSLLMAAKHTVKGGLELNYRHFTLAPRFLYRSKSYSARSDAVGNLASNRQFTVADLFARYDRIRLGQRGELALFVDIRNLLDRRYYNVYGTPDDGAFQATPQDPRRISGGVTISY